MLEPDIITVTITQDIGDLSEDLFHYSLGTMFCSLGKFAKGKE